MIKAVFFDVDGTLFSHHTGEISKSTRDAVEHLHKQGIPPIIATGRHMLELMDMPVLDLPYGGYITLNGQLCLDENRKLFYGNAIEGEDKQQLVEIFEEKKIPLMFIEENRMYINFVNEAVIQAQADIHTAVPDVDTYHGDAVYMAVAYLNKEQEITIEPFLRGCKITRWNQNAVDIISASGGKISGIKHYMKQNGWQAEELMAFGDADNDIEMLKFAGIGIAMGNAKPHVKEQADYVTADVDAGGIEEGLRHFGVL